MRAHARVLRDGALHAPFLTHDAYVAGVVTASGSGERKSLCLLEDLPDPDAC